MRKRPSTRRAGVYTTEDNTRNEPGETERFYAEVVVRAGDADEQVLYCTTWHATPDAASAVARRWMQDNDIADE